MLTGTIFAMPHKIPGNMDGTLPLDKINHLRHGVLRRYRITVAVNLEYNNHESFSKTISSMKWVNSEKPLRWNAVFVYIRNGRRQGLWPFCFSSSRVRS